MIQKEQVVRFCDLIALCALYLLIFFIPIAKGGIESCFGLACACFIIKKVIKPDFSSWKIKANIPLVLFGFFSALSLLNSGQYLLKGINSLFFKWFEYIFIYLMVIDIINTRKRFFIAIGIIIAGSILLSFDGLWQQFMGVDFIRGKEIIDSNPRATFNNANGFAAYATVLLLLNFSFLTSLKQKKLWRFLLGLNVLLLLTNILLTFSRGAWISLVVGLFFILFLYHRARKFLLIFSILLLILFLTIPVLKIAISGGGDSQRFALWRTAWEMIKDNPFLGKGIGTFMSYFRQYAKIPGVYYAHNCALQIWAETGIFSLLSFFVFLFMLFSKTLYFIRKYNDGILVGLAAAIIAYFFHSFFEVHLYSLQLAVLFWVFLGLLVSRMQDYKCGRIN